jgi:hypothetical protein
MLGYMDHISEEKWRAVVKSVNSRLAQSITDVVITWACGEAGHLNFQLWIGVVFAVASAATLVIFWTRLLSLKQSSSDSECLLAGRRKPGFSQLWPRPDDPA